MATSQSDIRPGRRVLAKIAHLAWSHRAACGRSMAIEQDDQRPQITLRSRGLPPRHCLRRYTPDALQIIEGLRREDVVRHSDLFASGATQSRTCYISWNSFASVKLGKTLVYFTAHFGQSFLPDLVLLFQKPQGFSNHFRRGSVTSAFDFLGNECFKLWSQRYIHWK